MKRLFAALFRIPLIWAEEFDGEASLHFVHVSPFGVNYIKRAYVYVLKPDGTLSGAAMEYFLRWMPANKYAEELFK